MILNTLAVTLLALTTSIQSFSADDVLAVDIVTQNGTVMQFPYFGSELRSIQPELRQIIAEDLEEMLNAIVGTLRERLVIRGRNLFESGYVWASLGARLIKMAKTQDARRRPHRLNSTDFRQNYNRSMQDLFKTVMRMGSEKAKELEGTEKDPEGVAAKLEVMKNDLIEAIRASPTGWYLDWNSAQWGDKSLVEAVSDMIGQLKHNNYKALFACIDKLFKLLVVLSNR